MELVEVRQKKIPHLWIPSLWLSGRCSITTNTMFLKKQKQAAAIVKLLMYALNLQQESNKCFLVQNKTSVAKIETTVLNKTIFKKKQVKIIITIENQNMGLISSVNFEISITGKNPNTI